MIDKVVANDAKTLTEIALKSKAFWGYPNKLLEIWKEDLTITPEILEVWSGAKFVIENEIIGFYLLNRVNARTCFLEFLFVRPEFIRKKIGRQLLTHAIESCSGNSCEILNVLSDPNAEEFYAKFGFKVIAKRESLIAGRLLPEMELEFLENM